MDKTVYYSKLYDYYGGLLTDNQREIFEDIKLNFLNHEFLFL